MMPKTLTFAVALAWLSVLAVAGFVAGLTILV
jgi:hypothetical protein